MQFVAFLREAAYHQTMALIAPSILSADFGRLAEEVKKLTQAGADAIHVDIMDGHFVPNLTFGPIGVQAIRKATSLHLDVHLMIEQPELWIERYTEAGASLIHIHAEACVHLHRVLQQIKASGAKTGVALNPSTPLSVLEYVLDQIDRVLIMTVNPGFGGQIFLQSILPKIQELAILRKTRGLPFQIEVDGGVTLENIQKISEAGADMVVSGSGVFASDDYAANMLALRRASTSRKPT